MDDYTRQHLEIWLDREFGGADDLPLIRAAMIATYESDPEYWGMAAWWHCYDACVTD